MKPADVPVLVAEVRAMYPQMTLVPGIVDAWGSIVGDYALDECREALTRWAMDSSAIPAPADIRRMIRAGREQAAQEQAARRALASDGRRHRMPEWFGQAFRESLDANRGRYREMWEARRAAKGVEGQYVPMGNSWLSEAVRDPMQRQAGEREDA